MLLYLSCHDYPILLNISTVTACCGMLSNGGGFQNRIHLVYIWAFDISNTLQNREII